ncbi:LETM1-related biofilm-associated protein [Pseudozobellia thermophila]|uniref:LETM1-like protein n=1 Tax=Pseudozobellia thermophila TaxID=192903 RepID=A0A1M6FL16_9FLAO|nr:LETM1-related biofilm-associated protein [Pseudozobellia thermophila]SHI98407.1 LETM1-like protein [Pseudozobellia thermophila]
MNPSAPGWIDKFGSLVDNDQNYHTDYEVLYATLKHMGFVYGINTYTPDFTMSELDLSEDEKAKINLLTALYGTFTLELGRKDFPLFLQTVFKFYQDLEVGNGSLFNRILSGTKTSAQLEKLINSRVYLEDNPISKTFSSFITNSLLFIDVLLFRRYTKNPKNIREHAKRLEYLTINITYHALNSKKKNKSDERLAQLFASSLTFIDSQANKFDGLYRDHLLKNESIWENRYFLDIACLTVWEDQSLEYRESEFICALGRDLGFDETHIKKSIREVQDFFSAHMQAVPFLKDTNLALQLHDSMSKIVNKLILRNSKRLQKELTESKELVFLISKATVKDLTPEERKKVQNQLIDIFKSIPSLAIFMLPGGAVLLPLFIKLIPKLLPSSFDENRIEK